MLDAQLAQDPLALVCRVLQQLTEPVLIEWAQNADPKKVTPAQLEAASDAIEEVRHAVELHGKASDLLATFDDLNQEVKHRIELLGYYYFMTGRVAERSRVRMAGPDLAAARKLAEARTKGGKNTGYLSVELRGLILAERARLIRDNKWNKSQAAREIATQLNKGIFPGIPYVVGYSDDYVARMKIK